MSCSFITFPCQKETWAWLSRSHLYFYTKRLLGAVMCSTEVVACMTCKLLCWTARWKTRTDAAKLSPCALWIALTHFRVSVLESSWSWIAGNVLCWLIFWHLCYFMHLILCLLTTIFDVAELWFLPEFSRIRAWNYKYPFYMCSLCIYTSTYIVAVFIQNWMTDL